MRSIIRSIIQKLILVGVVLTLIACRRFSAGGLPESPLVNISPVTTPTVNFVPTTIPTPFSEKGSVTGRLVSHISKEPIGGVIVYLGEISPFEIEGTESHIITVLPNSSPSALTDKYGYFAFLNVNPGMYAMVIWLPEKSWVISTPDTGKDILVRVETGKVTTLGELFINPPNLP